MLDNPTLESRYLPALFIAKFLKHVPQLFRQPMIEYTQKCYYGVL